MGWRGVLRSMSAASNRSRRANERAQRALDRAGSKVDAIEGQIDREIARDTEKIRQFEEKIRTKPISHGSLRFNRAERRFVFKSIADDSGALRWTIDISLTCDAAQWSGALVVGTLTLQPLEVCISQYGVVIAMEASRNGDGRPPKLLFKSDPARNRVYLSTGGKVYQALEGTFDSPDIDRTVLVAFPLPASDAQSGDIIIQTEHGNVHAHLVLSAGWSALAASNESVSEKFARQCEESLAPTRQQIAETRQMIHQKASGCALVVGGFLLSLTAVAGAIHQLVST